MISQQIALKPFLQQMAQRQGQSYEAFLSKTAAAMPAEGFESNPQLDSFNEMAKVLRAKPEDVQEVRQTLLSHKNNALAVDAFVNSMLVSAMALEPGCKVGLKGAIRNLFVNEDPLPQTSIEQNQLKLLPSLEQDAARSGGSVEGLLQQVGQARLAPEQLAASSKAVSVFRLDPQEVAGLEARLGDPALAENAMPQVILNAVGYEPTFRAGLMGLTQMLARETTPLNRSCFEPAAG